MLKYRLHVGLFCLALLLFGCKPVVLKQDIPVSTNPMLARIYADGQLVGQTPGSVSLERNRDHILTLVKENYLQEDVVIKKQYQSDNVFMKAVRSGVNAGLFHKDARMGINRGYSSMSMQEETGEAYVLIPAVVKIDLIPLQIPPQSSQDEQGGGSRHLSDTGHNSTSQPPVTSDSPPPDTGLSAKGVIKGIIAGAAIGAAQTKPVEKKWDTSSSSKTYRKSDGTVVTEKSSTSAGVSVNPAGLVNVLNRLFN